MNELPNGLLFTTSGWSQHQVKSSTVSRHWNKFVQNCMLYTNITLTSRNLCFPHGRACYLPIPGSPDSWRVKWWTAKLSRASRKSYRCMNCVESSWLIRRLNQPKQWWPFFFQYIHRQMRLHLHLIPWGCAACESELISICNDIQLIKKCLQAYRTMILLCSAEAFLMTTAITNLFIFKICSVHMHHRCKVAQSQSHNLFSAFPRRNTLIAVKNLFIVTQKCFSLSKSCSLCCTVNTYLSGWVWSGKRNFWTGDLETFSGQSNKGSAVGPTARKTRLREFAWHSSKHHLNWLKCVQLYQANHGNGYMLHRV